MSDLAIIPGQRAPRGSRGIGRPFWTDEIVADLRRLYAAGIAQASIAVALGCERRTVSAKIGALGLTRDRPKAHQPAPKNAWPDDDAAKLRELHADGKSFSEIAAAFGGRYSRNSVIGKAARLRLPARSVPPRIAKARPISTAKPAKSAPRPKSAVIPIVAPPPKTSAWELMAGSSGVLFLDWKPSECAWPCWPGGTPLMERRCCGEPVADFEGQPYCQAHRLLNRGRETPSERDAVHAAKQIGRRDA